MKCQNNGTICSQIYLFLFLHIVGIIVLTYWYYFM